MATFSGEEEVIARLSQVFGPFLYSEPEVRSIRETLRTLPDVYSDSDQRDKYSQALQDHENAQRLLEEASNGPEFQVLQNNANQAQFKPADLLRSHMKLLKLRRLRNRGEILERHIRELEHQAAVEDVFGFRSETPISIQLDENPITLTPSLDGLNAQATVLTRDLETAVLRAEYQLRRSKMLLREAKEKRGSQNGAVSDNVCRVQALSRTRDVLIQWIEQHIFDEATFEDEPVPSEPAVMDQHMPRTVKIAGLYNDYLTARTNLLETCQASINPLRTESTKMAVSKGPIEPNQATPVSKAGTLLPFVETHLLKPLQQHNTDTTYQSFISNGLSAQLSRTTEALDRLRDESHLLPILSNVSSLNLAHPSEEAEWARLGNSQPFQREDLLLHRAENWSLADHEATKIATAEIVHDVAEGNEFAASAEKNLDELNQLMQQRQRLAESSVAVGRFQ